VPEQGRADPRLVVDWDGTVTVRDSQWMLIERFGDWDLFQETSAALGKSLTLREVLQLEVGSISVPFDEALEFLLQEVEVRPGFRELVRRFRPLVLSSGFAETIEPILERERIEVEFAANRLDPAPDGWRVVWADETPCPVCGDFCKRRALPPERPLVFVGDGYSDRCAALAADRVFARRGLAEYLTEEGVPYEPFETFFEVMAALEQR
jgi:2-hydroxy-3-keto-5-methylthiopentenyl-1-phosphate phosphatase